MICWTMAEIRQKKVLYDEETARRLAQSPRGSVAQPLGAIVFIQVPFRVALRCACHRPRPFINFVTSGPYLDGTTHIVLEPLDLMARLAALVPPPRKHLTRYHGVFAPHSKLRAAVTPAGRGKGKKPPAEEGADKPATPRHVAMNWAKRLKRVFGVEIEACARCGGKLRVIVSIEEPQVIAKILAHLERTAPEQRQSELPLGARAPPMQARLL